MKTLHPAVKNNTDDKKLHKALGDLENVLSMKIIHELNSMEKLVHGGKAPKHRHA